jgi:hypothetical protein
VVDHVAGFGATCIETALVVDHVRGLDARCAELSLMRAHLEEFGT